MIRPTGSNCGSLTWSRPCDNRLKFVGIGSPKRRRAPTIDPRRRRGRRRIEDIAGPPDRKLSFVAALEKGRYVSDGSLISEVKGLISSYTKGNYVEAKRCCIF